VTKPPEPEHGDNNSFEFFWLRVTGRFAFGLCGATFVLVIQLLPDAHPAKIDMGILIFSMPCLILAGMFAELLPETDASRWKLGFRWASFFFMLGVAPNLVSLFNVFAAFNGWYAVALVTGIVLAILVLFISVISVKHRD